MKGRVIDVFILARRRKGGGEGTCVSVRMGCGVKYILSREIIVRNTEKNGEKGLGKRHCLATLVGKQRNLKFKIFLPKSSYVLSLYEKCSEILYNEEKIVALVVFLYLQTLYSIKEITNNCVRFKAQAE